MAAWLGITILVFFSLGLNWFMRGARGRALHLPKDLGVWVRGPTSEPTPPGTYWEQRMLLIPGTLFKRASIFEQRRLRRTSDGEILEVRPEQRLPRS
jgi:hypothetical protein